MTMRMRRARRVKITALGVIPQLNEDDMQRELLKWADGFWVTIGVAPAARTVRLGAMMFAVPNGMAVAGDKRQRARFIAKMKAMGMKEGVSDLVIPVPVAGQHGMFLELKRDKDSVVSAAQEGWIALMRIAGYRAEIAVGLEEAKKMIWSYVQPVSRAVNLTV